MARVQKSNCDATKRIITLRLYDEDINMLNKIIAYHAEKNRVRCPLSLSAIIRDSLAFYYKEVIVKKGEHA